MAQKRYNLFHKPVLKGHGFSRAVSGSHEARALAPEETRSTPSLKMLYPRAPRIPRLLLTLTFARYFSVSSVPLW